MLAKKYVISLAVISGLLLVGCNSSSTQVKPDPSTESGAAVTESKSTGDADKDIEAIESEIEALDVDSDFPDFNDQDFE